MAESCCSSPVPQSLDQTQAVEARYGAAAQEQEACLCTPVGFDPALLKVIPVSYTHLTLPTKRIV